ncbi:MAG TPA: hypothetical protein VNO22_09575 [Planctomycetota bacterium]|nr:hypothetical protein [Planctomycetota bacterium]
MISLVREKCVAVAIDQWYHRRQKDAEGDFYRKVAAQAPYFKDFNQTTQGLYLCDASGKLLAWTNHRSPERVKEMLRRGLDAFVPAEAPLLENPRPDPDFNFRPPAGGLVVTVTSKVLEGYEPADDAVTRAFQESLGRDVLWVRKDEHEALARGEFPATLGRRIARYHLFDNTRGEPAPWPAEAVRAAEFFLRDGVLTGRVHLETPDGRLGYRADLRGRIETAEGRVTRFDLVARGAAWGHSGCTEAAAPKDRFTLGIAFRLASGQDEADRVMPQGAKAWLPEYLR